MARALVALLTCLHSDKCFTIFCFGLPAIGGKLTWAVKILNQSVKLI